MEVGVILIAQAGKGVCGGQHLTAQLKDESEDMWRSHLEDRREREPRVSVLG